MCRGELYISIAIQSIANWIQLYRSRLQSRKKRPANVVFGKSSESARGRRSVSKTQTTLFKMVSTLFGKTFLTGCRVSWVRNRFSRVCPQEDTKWSAELPRPRIAITQYPMSGVPLILLRLVFCAAALAQFVYVRELNISCTQCVTHQKLSLSLFQIQFYSETIRARKGQ